MFDSLPYRNDAAITMRRLIRSLPLRQGVMGVATCDKGLPATMMALAGCSRSARHPGARRRHAARRGAKACREDAGTVQTIGARFAHDLISLDYAASMGCRGLRIAGRRLPVPGHRGHGPGRGRGAGAGPAPQRALPVGRARLA